MELGNWMPAIFDSSRARMPIGEVSGLVPDIDHARVLAHGLRSWEMCESPPAPILGRHLTHRVKSTGCRSLHFSPKVISISWSPRGPRSEGHLIPLLAMRSVASLRIASFIVPACSAMCTHLPQPTQLCEILRSRIVSIFFVILPRIGIPGPASPI